MTEIPTKNLFFCEYAITLLVLCLILRKLASRVYMFLVLGWSFSAGHKNRDLKKKSVNTSHGTVDF